LQKRRYSGHLQDHSPIEAKIYCILTKRRHIAKKMTRKKPLFNPLYPISANNNHFTLCKKNCSAPAICIKNNLTTFNIFPRHVSSPRIEFLISESFLFLRSAGSFAQQPASLQSWVDLLRSGSVKRKEMQVDAILQQMKGWTVLRAGELLVK
jgi:hypothetical protein